MSKIPGGETSSFLMRLFAREIFFTFRDDWSDPRDGVFALLVLMKQTAVAQDISPLPLDIDYSKDVGTVFTETAALLIETSGWLGVLAMIHPQRRLENTLPNAPSWVPDLHSCEPRTLHTSAPGMESRIARHASEITSQTRPSIINGHRLFVKAERIGVVSDVGDFMERGVCEATARLLLRVPDAIWPGYTCIDYWTDTMDAVMAPQLQPPDSNRRKLLRQWIVSKLLRLHWDAAFGAERLARLQQHLESHMPSFETLAQADVTKTLPTIQDWSTV